MRSIGARHLPVVEFGELVGILSDRDILRYAEAKDDTMLIGRRKVRDAMTVGTHTCKIGDRIGDIATEMITRHIDALPVINDDGHLIGIITSTDLLSYLRKIEGELDRGASFEAKLHPIQR
jgi:acetoin utilization protein AcuB